MDGKAQQARRIYSEINDILFTYWDPIGISAVAPKDEYEAYVADVYRALANDKSERALVRLLTTIENQRIGLRAPVGRKTDAARRLRELDIRVSAR
jgi:hypothetical protein